MYDLAELPSLSLLCRRHCFDLSPDPAYELVCSNSRVQGSESRRDPVQGSILCDGKLALHRCSVSFPVRMCIVSWVSECVTWTAVLHGVWSPTLLRLWGRL